MMKTLQKLAVALAALLLLAAPALASEADLAIPDLHAGTFFGGAVSAWWLLFCGALVICGTLGISLYLRAQIHALPAHKSMLDVAEIIFQTCKTYLRAARCGSCCCCSCSSALAIAYYLVGFSHDEYEFRLTDRARSRKCACTRPARRTGSRKM